MCGLIGSFILQPSADFRSRLISALKALNYRGPDDRGIEIEDSVGGTVALGHTRLSIIDLSPGGHQPMHSHDGRLTIIFNGEIYNYRELRQDLSNLGYTFRTESDTEVLLAAWSQWGVEGLHRLIGMFAFAILDRNKQTLTLVRDAFGIKPLYYQQEKGGIVFASELPALQIILGRRPRLNLQRAYDYLAWGSYDSQPDTLFEGIVHLMPGYLLEIDLSSADRSKPVRWWWPKIEERTDLNFAQAAEQLRELFLTSIRLHLRSDVPLGVTLSGGIDSSAVVCAMRHLEPNMPIHTFSFVARGSTQDEERWVDLVANYVGAIKHKVVILPEEMLVDLDDMILAQGEPFGSTSIYAQYRVFRLAREYDITVTLEGQGADELLAGYDGYPQPRIKSLIERRQIRSLIQFLWYWSQWPGRGFKQGAFQMLGALIPEHLIPLLKSTPLYNRTALYDRTATTRCLDFDYLKIRGIQTRPTAFHNSAVDAQGRRLPNTLRHALTQYGLPSLLRHSDRNAMRWSIESRVPFLTTGIAEYLLSLPEHYLLSQQGETKSVLRSALRGIVPDHILDRKDKIGFATPEHNWLQCIDTTAWLSSEKVEEIPFLNHSALRHYIHSQIKRTDLLNSQTWRFLNFCRWVEIIEPVI
jgi:asparagine synthase (glutamine-hydrolysing)